MGRGRGENITGDATEAKSVDVFQLVAARSNLNARSLPNDITSLDTCIEACAGS